MRACVAHTHVHVGDTNTSLLSLTGRHFNNNTGIELNAQKEKKNAMPHRHLQTRLCQLTADSKVNRPFSGKRFVGTIAGTVSVHPARYADTGKRVD